MVALEEDALEDGGLNDFPAFLVLTTFSAKQPHSH